MENILELRQVSKTFPKSAFTLDNVTFMGLSAVSSEKTAPGRPQQLAAF